MAVFNFSDVLQEGYTLNIGAGKKLRLLLDSTEDRYGGCAPHYPGTATAGADGCVKLNVPRYSAAYYELDDASTVTSAKTRKRNANKK